MKCGCQGFISYVLVFCINTVIMYGYRGNTNTYKTFTSMHYLPNACCGIILDNQTYITKALIKTNDNVLNCC